MMSRITSTFGILLGNNISVCMYACMCVCLCVRVCMYTLYVQITTTFIDIKLHILTEFYRWLF